MTDSEPMTCRELVELVTEYLEGALPPAERARFERHLGVCPGCVTYVAQIRQTVRLVGNLGEVVLPPELEGEFLRAFRDWTER
jgi:anti-sigma factor RsiW